MKSKKYIIIGFIVISIVLSILVLQPKNAPENIPTRNDTTASGFTYTNSSVDTIQVELPFPDAVTGKTFGIIGKARGVWFFEGSFPIDILDSDGKVLTTVIAKAGADWMTNDFVPFRADVTVRESYIGKATIVLKKDNPSGIKEKDASLSFPITIEY